MTVVQVLFLKAYNTETWTLKEEQKRKLKNDCLEENISQRDRMRNVDIKKVVNIHRVSTSANDNRFSK